MRHPIGSQGGLQIAPNQNIIIDQERRRQQQQAKMQSSLDQLQEARKVKNNSGKLFLAAIVHYDSCSPTRPEAAANCDESAKRLSDRTEMTSGEQQASNTHEQPALCRRLGKFSRLFSRRANKQTAQSCTRKIDDLEGAGNCEQEPGKRAPSSARNTADATMMDRLGLQTGRCQSDSVSSASLGTPECQLVSELRRESNVIEFKFDLIVEGDQDDEIDAQAAQHSSETGASPQTRRRVGKILRPIKQRKLLDQVNDLVESFVLDSVDGCLMSAGLRHLAHKSGHQFDYSLELAKLTLAYVFQLLRAAKEQAGAEQRAPNYLSARPSPLKIEAFSIELEATLFEAAGSDKLIEITDLLAADLAPPNIAAGASAINQKLECHTVEEALEVLQLVRSNLAPKTTIEDQPGDQNNNKPNRLLMISLKLKQLINGGSFSNRLCLLDLAEPGTSELSSIFSAIFNGQALGYLKREKVHLRSLEMQLDSMRRTQERVESCASGPTASEHLESTQQFLKKHHQIASFARLIQAQWLIYKQLSAALIKSLVIVHCHRWSRASNESAQPPSDLQLLMKYNLDLLEFARTIQRASSSRLRRRRRHLRSHMNSATNLSFVSDTNISISLSDEEDSAAYQMARRLGEHDLMIAAPSLRARPVWARRRRRPNRFDYFEDDDDQSSQYDLTASALSTRSRFSHHHHRRTQRTRSGGRHHVHHEHSHNRYDSHRHEHRYQRPLYDDQLSIDTSYQEARASSLTGRRGRSELTGSSSLASTSSGSQRGRASKAPIDASELLASAPASHSSQISQLISYQRQLLRQQQQQQPMSPMQQANQKQAARSDTEDSLASANLTSCSSQSMRDRKRSGDLHRLLKVMQSGGSREEELRWFNASGAKLQIARKQSNTLDSASESTSIDSPSIELQSFCSNANANNNNNNNTIQTPNLRTLQTVSLAPGGDETQSRLSSNQNEDRLLDNASDICSVVAEPPRQLKLEQFLNQLSSVIAPNKTATHRAANEAERRDPFVANETSSHTNRPSAPIDHGDDEDEDCKSHSSILDHLSSLTLETNLRLRLQSTPSGDYFGQQPLEACRLHSECGSISNEQSSVRVSIIDESASSKPAGGHLQQLLESTLRMQTSDASERKLQQQRLGALSIDCHSDDIPSRGRPTDQMSAHVPSDLGRNSFTPSSSDSCASGSSSSSSDNRNGRSNEPESIPHVPSSAMKQLYSSVIRQHT